jgi:3-deoxy-D-manno-octulosonic-acid transferase
VSEVAFIGSSLLEGCSGHNLAEDAVAGCAVLVGEHAGHFSTMADELNQAAVSEAD